MLEPDGLRHIAIFVVSVTTIVVKMHVIMIIKNQREEEVMLRKLQFCLRTIAQPKIAMIIQGNFLKSMSVGGLG